MLRQGRDHDAARRHLEGIQCNRLDSRHVEMETANKIPFFYGVDSSVRKNGEQSIEVPVTRPRSKKKKKTEKNQIFRQQMRAETNDGCCLGPGRGSTFFFSSTSDSPTRPKAVKSAKPDHWSPLCISSRECNMILIGYLILFTRIFFQGIS